MTELQIMPPLRPAGVPRRPRRLPFPLEEPGVQLYAQARQALWSCLPRLGLQPGDEVLVPSYHHGSEVEALLQAGLSCRFYRAAEDLQPEEDVLEALLTGRTRALHLIHHLGFPQDVGRWRRWCDDRALLLIEDAAQSWLAEHEGGPVGAHGDLSFFCLYKSVGVPDGAAVVGRFPLPRPDQRGGAGVLRLVTPVARQALRRVGRSWSRPYDQGRDIAVPPRSRGASAATHLLLRGCGAASAAARRREAYRQLLAALGHLVPMPFAELPAGASPWVFPVAVDDKDAAMATLAGCGVRALDLWRYPHPVWEPPDACLASSYRQHVVGLPVHQGLTSSDLARVVSAARDLRPAGELTRR